MIANTKSRMNKPNIVWLVQDHVIWKHFRDTDGPKPELPTYQRIISEGIDFDRTYTITPLCTPARGSLLTGVYPHKHGLINNGKMVALKNEKGSNIGTFNSYLLEQGYRTGYFGKWHAGKGIAQDCDFEGFSLPGYGSPYVSEEYTNYLEKNNLPKPIVDLEWRLKTKGELIKDIDFTQEGIKGISHPAVGVIKGPAETTESAFISHLASKWLEERAKEDQPFIMRVDVWGPHQPYLVSEPFKDTINPKNIPEYPNFKNDFADRPSYHKRDREEWRNKTGYTTWKEWQPIVARAYENFSQTDSALGKILDTLEKTGLDENTIVIYTADHGDILASNGGLFDKDSMLTEETMSIPLAIKWPKVINDKRKSHALVSNMDIVPTILEMAGVQVPEHMDGKSFVKLLKDPNEVDFREDLMSEHFGHINYDNIQRVLYYGEYKYVAHLDDTDELYDLRQDPFELKNLIDDPDMCSVLKSMRKRLKQRMDDFSDHSDESKRLMEKLI